MLSLLCAVGLGLFAGLAVVAGVHQFGKYYQPLRRRTYVIGRITSDESQLRIIRLFKHAAIVWLHNPLAGDFIGEDAAVTANLDLVAFGQFIDMTKECIAMGRD